MCLDCSTIFLALAMVSAKLEKAKYTVSTQRIWAQNQVRMRKRKQTLALGDLFLQEGSFTLFSFQVCVHLLVLVIGHAPPSTLVLWKKVKIKRCLVCLEHLAGNFPPRRLGATTRVF